MFLFFIEAVAKSERNKIKENFRKGKQRRERMSRSGVDNKKLPECKLFQELSFLNLCEKPQESHSNFIGVNKALLTETFVETAAISEGYPRDSNFRVTPKSKGK